MVNKKPSILFSHAPITIPLTPKQRDFFERECIVSLYNDYVAKPFRRTKARLTSKGFRLGNTRDLSEVTRLFTPGEARDSLEVRGFLKKATELVKELNPVTAFDRRQLNDLLDDMEFFKGRNSFLSRWSEDFREPELTAEQLFGLLLGVEQPNQNLECKVIPFK